MIVREFTLTHPEAPKSLNAGGAGSRRHWAVGFREKQKWAEVFATLLEIAKVPRGMSHCRLDAVIRWKTRRRRDVTNYTAPIVKPFADVLVSGAIIKQHRLRIAGGWLADDTDEFFTFGTLRFEHPDHPWTNALGNAELVLVLAAAYPDIAPAPASKSFSGGRDAA